MYSLYSESYDSFDDMEDTSINSPVLLMTIPPAEQRSVSPMTPSPSREMRGMRLFRAISRKLGRRSVEDLSYVCEEDSRSSSTDSCSSTSASARCSRSKKLQNGASSCSSGGSGFRSNSPNHISSSGSDTGSDSQNNQSTSRLRHHHSTTGSSFRKVFESLSLSTSPRSQSCSSKEPKKKTPKKSTPKRILRPPVTYTYVRGLSGLPTQRVPRTPPSSGQTGCGCVSNNGYVSGLNR